MKRALLTILRDKNTSMEEFKAAADRLSVLLAAEVALTIKLHPIHVKTHYQKTEGVATDEEVTLVAILRSGLAMLSPFISLFPKAKIGFFGIKRDEKTAIHHLYYEKLPKIPSKNRIFLLEPMIATGGSTIIAIEKILQTGAEEHNITLVGCICSQEGLQAVKSRFPQIQTNIVAEDHGLNADKFIIPGIGDFGDRYFGTLDEKK